MLSFGFRIFCWYREFCHRTGSDLLLFLKYRVIDGDISSIYREVSLNMFMRSYCLDL